MVKAAQLTTLKRNHDDKSSAETFEKKDLKVTKINTLPGFPRVMQQTCGFKNQSLFTSEFRAHSQHTKTQSRKSELLYLATCYIGQTTDHKSVQK